MTTEEIYDVLKAEFAKNIIEYNNRVSDDEKIDLEKFSGNLEFGAPSVISCLLRAIAVAIDQSRPS